MNKLIAEYDPCNHISSEVNYRLEQLSEEYESKKKLLSEYDCQDIDELKEKLETEVFEDADFFRFLWEDFSYYITLVFPLEKKYVVLGSNMGWQNREGWTVIDNAESGEDFIRQLVGFDCDSTIKIYKQNDNTFTARVSHHDSPTGEGREIIPEDIFLKNVLKEFDLKDLQVFMKNWFLANDGDLSQLDDDFHKKYGNAFSRLSRKKISEYIKYMLDNQWPEFEGKNSLKELDEIIQYYLKPGQE